MCVGEFPCVCIRKLGLLFEWLGWILHGRGDGAAAARGISCFRRHTLAARARAHLIFREWRGIYAKLVGLSVYRRWSRLYSSGLLSVHMTFFNPQAFDFSYILLENYDENIKKCKVLTLAHTSASFCRINLPHRVHNTEVISLIFSDFWEGQLMHNEADS